tara:strand:- start:1144 stop:1731 length:588 start_codon:yes stop_codon:yes gene_type:complete
MTTISPLKTILKKGLFGDHEGKNGAKLIEIKEITKLLIVQIAQYKNSSFQIENLNIDGLNLPNDALKVISNSDSRILWCGPKNWLLVSKKKDLLQILNKSFNENDFAVTDLSHSRAIIEIEGENSIEILKKGCPFNFNELKKDNCVNSVFNGLAITIDIINDNPYKIRLFTLRSFGESFYHSVSDACLEDGFKVV